MSSWMLSPFSRLTCLLWNAALSIFLSLQHFQSLPLHWFLSLKQHYTKGSSFLKQSLLDPVAFNTHNLFSLLFLTAHPFFHGRVFSLSPLFRTHPGRSLATFYFVYIKVMELEGPPTAGQAISFFRFWLCHLLAVSL